eukprot:4731303-Pyramimonas_sp.AAC.1
MSSGRAERAMTRAPTLVCSSVVMPVSPKGLVSVRSTAVPSSFRSHLPAMRLPPHAMVRSITVLPASTPRPTATVSCASAGVPLRPEEAMMSASGKAPRRGRRRPPTRPGFRTSRSSSEPSPIIWAAVVRM